MRQEAMARAIGDRDEQVLGLVMEKYAHLLWPIAAAVLKNVGSDQDVEECVADAFIYLWEHPGHFDPSRGKLKTLLCILTRSRAIDRYRELSRRSILPLEEALCEHGLCIQEVLEEAETRAELRQLLQSLGEPNREILGRIVAARNRTALIARPFTGNAQKLERFGRLVAAPTVVM